MSDSISPALTPEEWTTIGNAPSVWVTPRGVFVGAGRAADGLGEQGLMFAGHERHGLGAALLHKQSFGFTHEDVALLRSSPAGHMGAEVPEWRAAYESLADRIAALLPPEVP